MKVEKITVDNVTKIKFIADTQEETLILGSLRNHYFFGDDSDGTYPEYDGMESNDNYVTALKFRYNSFK